MVRIEREDDQLVSYGGGQRNVLASIDDHALITSAYDGEGRFRFVVTKPEPVAGNAPHFDVYVFARGLLRHQLTRMYFPDEGGANAVDPVLSSLSEDDRATLIADPEDGALRFDVRMQGERATVFFAV